MLGVTADPVNPTSIVIGALTLAGVVYTARKSAQAQRETANAQSEANRITQESQDWARLNSLVETLQSELEGSRVRARELDEWSWALRTHHQMAEQETQQVIRELRLENRRLRVDLAGVVAVVRDEITREAAVDAYGPELLNLADLEEEEQDAQT